MQPAKKRITARDQSQIAKFREQSQAAQIPHVRQVSVDVQSADRAAAEAHNAARVAVAAGDDLTEISVVTFPALAEAMMDLAKSAPAAADWEAFMVKARLDHFRLKLKVNEISSRVRKAREQARLEHEALPRVEAPPRWMNI